MDDGARSLEEARRAIDRLGESGVRHIVTTPHIDATTIDRPEIFEKNQRRVEGAWERVVLACRGRRPSLSFHLGREIFLDSREPDTRDPRVRIARGPYVLVEYPRLHLPPGSEEVLHHIRSRGHPPIVAHVERYRYGPDVFGILARWREAGAALQVNAGALVGRFGPVAGRLAWELLERGWVDLLASDYHARGEPMIVESRRALSERDGERQADLLYGENPRRVLAGESLTPVPPIPASSGRWSRLRSALGRLGGSSP